jgi:hypothetical protein
MGTAAKVAFAAGAAALATVGVVAWRAAGSGDGAPPPVAVAGSPPTTPRPALSPTPAVIMPGIKASAPSPPRETVPPQDPARDKERAEGLLAREVSVALEEMSIDSALRVVARKVDLEPEYASDELRVHYSLQRTVTISLDSPIPFRDAVNLLLHMAPPPGRQAIGFEVRGDHLYLLPVGTPPTPKESEEDARKRQNQEDELLRALRGRTTTFAFDGNQTLGEALAYLRAQQSLNIVVDTGAMERCETLKVKLSLKDATIKEALDELLHLDPDLLWELRGNVVLVRKK